MNKTKSNMALVVAPPQKPADATLVRKISRALADLEEVREAHLPEVLEIGVSTKSRLMLFVVVEPAEKIPEISRKLARQLSGPFGFGSAIEFRAIPDNHSMLQNIRDTKSIVGWRD